MSTHSLMLMPHWPSKELYESCFDFFGFNVWEKNRNDRNCCVHVHIYAKPRHKLWFIINCRENMWWIFWKGSSSQDIKSPGMVGHQYNGKNSDKSCSQKNWITSSLRSMIDWVICIIKGPNSQYNNIVADDVFIEKISKRLQRGQRWVLCKTIALHLIFGDSVSLINIDKFLIMDPAKDKKNQRDIWISMGRQI